MNQYLHPRDEILQLMERIYRYLLDTDLDMKTGRIDPSLALETLIARLSAR